MAVKLQAKIIFISVLVFAFSFVTVQSSQAQIAVKNADLFEISFKKGQTVSTENMIRIGIEDPAIFRFAGYDETDYISLSETNENVSSPFYAEAAGGLAIGNPYSELDDNLLVQLNLENSTGRYIEKLTFAFDFVYQPDAAENTGREFHFAYRIGNNDWVKPKEGYFTTAVLEAQEEGWNSFSLQFSTENLFIRPGDKIELRWTGNDSSGSTYIPVALQRIELSSGVAKPHAIDTGSILITEILPFSEDISVDSSAEYIELYNQTPEPVSLQGMRIYSDYNEHVIQHKLVISPYETFVMGYAKNNSVISDLLNYNYASPLLSESSGSLNLSYFTTPVSRATFRQAEPGRALVLNSLSDAFDGYSSLQDFSSSAERLSSSLYGSPGSISTDRKLFSANIDRKGWHLIAPPGLLSTSLSRDSGSAVYQVNSEAQLQETDMNELDVEQAFFVYHDSDQKKKLYASGMVDISASIKETVFDGYRLTGNPDYKPANLNQFTGRSNNQPFAAALVWNSEKQRFVLEMGSEVTVSPWNAIILPAEEDQPLTFSSDSRNETADPTRYISFQLRTQNENRRFETTDESAAIAFFVPGRADSTLHPGLPKIVMPSFDEYRQAYTNSFLYLENSDADFNANSLISLPDVPEETVVAGIGTHFNRSGTYRIEWGEIESFPDDWTIVFRDVLNEVTIDMREEPYYEFRARSSRSVNEHTGEHILFGPYEPEKPADRFFVYISPYPVTTGEGQVDETPESVILNQNYPNPFNPATTISFYLPERSHVRVGIYNVVGQQVGLLRDEQMAQGEHFVVWNASDMPSGIYIVQLETAGRIYTRKITLIK